MQVYILYILDVTKWLNTVKKSCVKCSLLLKVQTRECGLSATQSLLSGEKSLF